MKATPITVEQYLRDQLSKDRHTDTLEDIHKLIENYSQQGNGMVHTEAYPDKQAPAINLSDNKPSYPETLNESNNSARMENDRV